MALHIFDKKRLAVINVKTGRVLKLDYSGGYPRVWFNGKRWLMHRLVYTMFYGTIPEGLEINHIDGNIYNYHPDNLEAVTSSQNQSHNYKVLGHKSKGGVARRIVVINGVSYSSTMEASRKLGISAGALRSALTKRQMYFKGFRLDGNYGSD